MYSDESDGDSDLIEFWVQDVLRQLIFPIFGTLASLYFMSISAKFLGEDFEPKTPKSIKIVQNRRVNLKILANIKKN